MLTKTAEESVPTFLRHASKQDCLSCHQQQLPLAAISLAGSRKFTIDRDAARHQLELLKRFNSTLSILPPDERLSSTEVALQTTLHPEPAISNGYAAMGFVLQREPASMVTDTLVHQLATIQHADGHWSYNLPRPPIQASDITATALGLYTIKTFPIPSRGKELESRVERARAWLAKTTAETNEERVHQLLGLAWAGERPDVLKKLTEELIGQQRPDGGWGQLAGLPSDAYATGQSLYALLEGTKIPASDPAARRGIDSLLRTQLADGTWHVRTRSHPFQPPMDSSFPHGRDGWISATGTSWAVMALATSLDASQTPPAVPALTKATTPAPGGVKSSGPVEFARDIKPTLERSCIACHSGEKPKGGYDMTNRASLLKGGNRGELAVVPGNPETGHLIRLVQDQVEDLEMPPLATRGRYPRLTEDEIAKLRVWIAAGANWPSGVNLQPAGK
jgi:mono/diheme cytochrome c family protein